MRFLLLFLPLFTYGQEWTLLVVGTDSFCVAPLDEARMALSLRETADSVIYIERLENINVALAASELHKALDSAKEAKSKSDEANVELLKRNVELELENATLKRKVNRKNRGLLVVGGIAIGGIVKEGTDQLLTR